MAETWTFFQPTNITGPEFFDALFFGTFAEVAGGFQYAHGSNKMFFAVSPFGTVIGFDLRHDAMTDLLATGYDLNPDAVKAAVSAYKVGNSAPFDQLFYSGPINIIGSPGADSIFGTPAADMFSMGAGDDTVHAGPGNDTVDGGTGNDTLDGGDGVDVINYAGRTDAAQMILEVFSGKAIVEFSNPPSAQNAQALTADETDTFQNFENVNGSPGDDQITGDANANEIDGNQGKDNLKGLDGNDTLIGDKGRDTMEGGAGADGFVFAKANESVKGAQRDKILGFTHADEIDLSGIDANIHKAGNQKFKFIGGQDFHNIDGELRFAGDILAGDTNGNGIADFEVKVIGAAVAPGDLIL